MRWPLLWAASFGVSWDHVQSPMRKNLLSFTLFAQSVTSSWLEKDPVSSNSSPGLEWESVSQNTWPEEEWHHRAGSTRASRGPMQSESDKDKILAWQRRPSEFVSYIKTLGVSNEFWFTLVVFSNASSRQCCSAQMRHWKLRWMATTWALELWS